MSRSTLSEFSQLVLSIYRHAQELPVQQFQDKILAAIKPSLPFDASMWGTATMAPSGIDIHSIHLHNFSPETLAAYEKVKHQDTAAARMTQQPVATIGFNATAEFNRPDQGEIRQFAREFGHENFFITSSLNPVTRFVHWISLFRADPERHCQDSETEMLAHLAPHLMQALAINRRIHLDKLVGDIARQSWSVAIADIRGVPYHAGNQFWELVETEWSTQGRDCLPTALLHKLRNKNQVVGRNIVLHCAPEHGLLYLKVRPREKVDGLSPREYMVAKMLASGMSQKEVAVRALRSPETIRSQIRVVFEKLEITNVVMLAPHLALRDGY